MYKALFVAGATVLFGSLAVNILNYLFTLIMSRMLEIANFGTLNTYLSLFILITVPSSALTLYVAREVATETDPEKVSALVDTIVAPIFTGAIALWVVTLLLTPVITYVFHLTAIHVVLFSILMPLSIMSALEIGILQGLHAFRSLSLVSSVGASTKLLLGVGAVALGFSVGGILLALILAQIVIWTYAYRQSTRIIGNERSHALIVSHDMGLYRSVIQIAFISFLLALLTNSDVLFAKHYLSEFAAGQYSGLSTLGKLIFYGVTVFTTVLFPMVSRAHAKGKGEEIKVFGLVLVATCSAVAFAVLLFFERPLLFINLLVGSRFDDLAPYMGVYGIAIGCVAIATVSMTFFIAIKDTVSQYILLGCILVEFVLCYLDHAGIGSVVLAVLISASVLVVLLFTNLIRLYGIPAITRITRHTRT